MKIITLVDKRNRTNDFYVKHNMHAVEWAINKKLSKDKNLTKTLIIIWRHPLNRKETL